LSFQEIRGNFVPSVARKEVRKKVEGRGKEDEERRKEEEEETNMYAKT
jgi:hypothetical protein